jgi:hypothetical protein
MEKGTAKKRKKPKPSHMFMLTLEAAQTQVISQIMLAIAMKP